MRQWAILLTAIGVLGSGCSSTDPRHVHAEFALGLVDDIAVPAILASDAGTTLTILGDTVRLYSDGTGTLIRVMRVEQPAMAPSDHRSVSEFTYTIEQEHFELWLRCPPNADCLPGPNLVGELAGNTLVATDWGWPDRTFTYLLRAQPD